MHTITLPVMVAAFERGKQTRPLRRPSVLFLSLESAPPPHTTGNNAHTRAERVREEGWCGLSTLIPLLHHSAIDAKDECQFIDPPTRRILSAAVPPPYTPEFIERKGGQNGGQLGWGERGGSKGA